MSKLRADITWNNRFKSDSSPTLLNITTDTYSQEHSDINDDENGKETENVEYLSSKEELEEEDLSNLEEESDHLEEFGKYLEG